MQTYNPTGYSVEQIVNSLNYYQQQLMTLPNPPRNFQEQQMVSQVRAEIEKLTHLYNQAVQRQQPQSYQQPQYQQAQYQAPMYIPQQSPYPQQQSSGYALPLQPIQSPMTPSTTTNSSNDITGRYSNKKSTQSNPTAISYCHNQQPSVKEHDQKLAKQLKEPTLEEVKLYLPDDLSTIEKNVVLSSNSHKVKDAATYQEELKKLVEHRKIVSINDPLYKLLDVLLTDMFNKLAKNYIQKAITIDSLLADYEDIIKYMDSIELVKDQKELDLVLEYIFDMCSNITVEEIDGKAQFNIKINVIQLKDIDSYRDISKNIIGMEYIILHPDLKKTLGLMSDDLKCCLLEFTNGFITQTFYVANSKKRTTLHMA